MEAMLKSLKTAIFDIMETMYFLFPDEENAAISDCAEGQSVSIGITGSPGYLITLTCDTNLAVSMASLLLGIDEDEVDTDTVQKCLKETANIVTGNFLFGFKSEENRDETAASIPEKIKEIHARTIVPVAVGFGISTPEHVRKIAQHAEGVIVGSSIVRKIGELGGTPGFEKEVARYVGTLTEPLRGD